MKHMLTLVLMLAGCASTPIVDQAGVDQEAYDADLKECQYYADQVNSGQIIATSSALTGLFGGLLSMAVGDESSAKKAAGAGAIHRPAGLPADGAVTGRDGAGGGRAHPRSAPLLAQSHPRPPPARRGGPACARPSWPVAGSAGGPPQRPPRSRREEAPPQGLWVCGSSC
mgnify:CR=1 FL=1